MMKRLLAFAVLVLMPMAAAAQTVLIDGFGTNQPAVTRGTNGTTLFDHNPAGADVLGNRREGSLTRSGASSGNLDLQFSPGSNPGKLTYGSLDSFGSFTLLWRGQSGDLAFDADTAGVNTFTFDVDQLDLASNYVVTITSSNGANVATFGGNLPGGITNQTFSVPFLAFTGTINGADIDSVQFDFNANAGISGTDLIYDNPRFTFSTVPEPTTFALFGLAGASGVGYFRYRRRQKQMAESEAEVAAD